MSVITHGEYSQGPVPTVFVEQAPPQEQPQERSGGGMGAGVMIVLAILLIGILLAGSGGMYYFYDQASKKAAGLETQKVKLEKDLATATKALTEERAKLVKTADSLENYTLKFGQIEKLQKTGADEIAKLQDLLKRRPGAKVPDRLLQPFPWETDVVTKLSNHILAIKGEFTRIDTAPGRPIDTTPTQPRIGNGG